MYHDDPLDAYPKGEIFLGYSLEGFSVRVGVVIGYRDMGYSFTLHTPDRAYCLSTASEEDRDSWIAVIDKVLQRPLTPQDSSG
jgi:Arf-GAP with dual PH domain-containing protein